MIGQYRWCSSTKADTNTPAVIFSDPCRSRWFIFTKQIIVLFWVIIYSYLQRPFKIGVLETLYTRKTVSESLFNEPATFSIKDSEIDAFLWILRNCQEHQFYKNTLRLLILYLWNIFVTITSKFNASQPKWFFQPFETLKYWNVYMWNQNHVNVRNYSLSSFLIL